MGREHDPVVIEEKPVGEHDAGTGLLLVEGESAAELFALVHAENAESPARRPAQHGKVIGVGVDATRRGSGDKIVPLSVVAILE